MSETDRVDGEGREGSLERVPPRLGGGDAVEEEHRRRYEGRGEVLKPPLLSSRCSCGVLSPVRAYTLSNRARSGTTPQ